MENRLNLICGVRFAKLDDLILYRDNHDGTATVQAQSWAELPLFEGSGRMTVTDQKINGSRVFRSQITGRLKEIMPARCVGILQIDVCGSGTYLIGTNDLPVTIETTTTLTSKTFQITHENTHFPLKTAI